ncbi:MAG: hypothetical protein DMG15_02355 [Acidobacteria bacterium]|nr:MAG: hypothetical protein DMG15_02355 [Acidobacteriota bacterium]
MFCAKPQKFDPRTFTAKGDVVFKNLDLNIATEHELTVIFGKDHAKKIVDYRNQNGPFKSWEDLKRIPGMLGTMLDTLKRLGCTVGVKAA